MPSQQIDLRTPLSFRTSFGFPLQSAVARREVVVGGLWLLVPFVGWLMNMGHRIVMVHHMLRGRSAWPAWQEPWTLLRHGFVTFLGMVYYYVPAALFVVAAVAMEQWWPLVPAVVLFAAATIAIPGYMSHYCVAFDRREIFDPLRALRRSFEGGAAYWHAWAIALAALVLSFVGLLALGVGFLVSSVWFWQVAGFSFASVFSGRFALHRK